MEEIKKIVFDVRLKNKPCDIKYLQELRETHMQLYEMLWEVEQREADGVHVHAVGRNYCSIKKILFDGSDYSLDNPNIIFWESAGKSCKAKFALRKTLREYETEILSIIESRRVPLEIPRKYIIPTATLHFTPVTDTEGELSYRVVEVNAAAIEDLPQQYLKDGPCFYRGFDSCKKTPTIVCFENGVQYLGKDIYLPCSIYYLYRGKVISVEKYREIKSFLHKCGERLTKIIKEQSISDAIYASMLTIEV